jgi:hypothetical protein
MPARVRVYEGEAHRTCGAINNDFHARNSFELGECYGAYAFSSSALPRGVLGS